jgi:hypothetical protein
MNLASAIVAVALTITTQNVRVGMPPSSAHHDINRGRRAVLGGVHPGNGATPGLPVRTPRLGHLPLLRHPTR